MSERASALRSARSSAPAPRQPDHDVAPGRNHLVGDLVKRYLAGEGGLSGPVLIGLHRQLGSPALVRAAIAARGHGTQAKEEHSFTASAEHVVHTAHGIEQTAQGAMSLLGVEGGVMGAMLHNPMMRALPLVQVGLAAYNGYRQAEDKSIADQLITGAANAVGATASLGVAALDLVLPEGWGLGTAAKGAAIGAGLGLKSIVTGDRSSYEAFHAEALTGKYGKIMQHSEQEKEAMNQRCARVAR